MKAKKIEKFYVIQGVFLFLFLAMIFLIILPQFTGIKENFQNLVAKKQQIRAISEKEKNLFRFASVRSEVRENFKKAQELFLVSNTPVEFIDFLEEAASSSEIAMKISSISSAQKDKEYPWPSLIFHINAKGNFSNFMRFIEKIENNSYLTDIDMITIQKIEKNRTETDSSQETEISSDFSLRVFTK